MTFDAFVELMRSHGFQKLESVRPQWSTFSTCIEVFKRSSPEGGCMYVTLENGGDGRICRINLHKGRVTQKWSISHDRDDARAMLRTLKFGPSHEWVDGIRDALDSAC
jgi:hypothetical protein